MTDLCDLCNRVLVTGESVFTYWTPCTGTLEQAQSDPQYFWAQDPEWSACQTCHDWLQKHERGEVSRSSWMAFQVRRSLKQQWRHEKVPTAGAPVLEKLWFETHASFTQGVLESFLDHKIPEFREELQGMR